MHESHWGLNESPFRETTQAKYRHENSSFQEALARLHFLVDSGRRLGWLTGVHGSGRSLLLDAFCAEIAHQGPVTAVVRMNGLETDEMLWSLAAELGLNPRDDVKRYRLWRALKDRIVENRYQRRHTVIVLDDADRASAGAIANIERLVEIDPSPSARLTVVVSTDSGAAEWLGAVLLERCELRIELNRWEESDTADYLHDSLKKAGCETAIFDPSATYRIHQLGHGIPRRISQLAELSLLAGAGRQMDLIDEETVESAYRELSATARAS